MNYLAHLFLAGDDPGRLVGHMLGDFVAPREIAAFPPEIRAGIRLHQRVDAFSEDHAAFAASRRRFRPPYRRYSGIIVDLIYDHFLAAHWSEYSSGISLAEFARYAYGILQQHDEILPARLRRTLPYMVAEDWLGGYRDLENIGHALRGVSRRLSRVNPLDSAMDEVRANYAGLEGDFLVFFPELIEFGRYMDAQPSTTV